MMVVSRSKKRRDITNFTCITCGETKTISSFYMSSSVFHAGTGRIPYCKECVKDMCIDENLKLSIDKIKVILHEIDKPYIHSIMQSSYEQHKSNESYEGNDRDAMGIYFKNINSLPAFKSLNWEDSEFEEDYQPHVKSKFLLTDDIIDKWGEGYDDREYIAFERKYNRLKNNYPEKTSMHTEALLTYVRYKVKEELATAAGDVKEAKDWGGMADKAATAAKINPSQLSAADLQGGLSNFSDLLQAVEQQVDIIPILPQFKYRPNDAPDFIIWCYVNYIRDAKGEKLASYSDVYKFYDDRKREYIEQYGDPHGIFTKDTTDENREKIANFIVMPEGFDEVSPVGGEEDVKL